MTMEKTGLRSKVLSNCALLLCLSDAKLYKCKSRQNNQLLRQHTVPSTAIVSARYPHLEPDSESSTAVATEASDCLVVAVAMLPEVAEILACHPMDTHLLCVVA